MIQSNHIFSLFFSENYIKTKEKGIHIGASLDSNTMKIYIDKSYFSLVINKGKVSHLIFHFSFLPFFFFFCLPMQGTWNLGSILSADPLEEGMAILTPVASLENPMDRVGALVGHSPQGMRGLSSCSFQSLEHRLSSFYIEARHPMEHGISPRIRD